MFGFGKEHPRKEREKEHGGDAAVSRGNVEVPTGATGADAEVSPEADVDVTSGAHEGASTTREVVTAGGETVQLETSVDALLGVGAGNFEIDEIATYHGPNGSVEVEILGVGSMFAGDPYKPGAANNVLWIKMEDGGAVYVRSDDRLSLKKKQSS